MADEYIGAGNLWSVATNDPHLTGSAAEIQSTRLWKYVGEMSFWTQFMGPEGSFMPIIAKQDLTKEKGEIVHFYLATPDDDAPVRNDREIWGSEESTTLYQDGVLIGLVRHGKKVDKPLSVQRTKIDIVNYLYEAQRQWWVDKGPDDMITKKLTGSDYEDSNGVDIGEAATANTNVVYGGDAVSTGSIDESDKLTPDLIWKLSEAARMGKIGSTSIRKIHPVSTAGGPCYIFVGSPYQIGDLKHQAGSAWEDYQKYANVRGPDNPLFVGTGNLAGQLPTPVGKLYGVLIYEYYNMPLTTTWGVGGDVAGATGLLLGAEAGLFAHCYGPDWATAGGWYDEYIGVAVKALMGFDKAYFNSLDNGVIAVKTAAKIHYTNT
jgi:N4-gp56 family major capsid protein